MKRQKILTFKIFLKHLSVDFTKNLAFVSFIFLFLSTETLTLP
jgi:hypothetical protein